MSWAQLEIELPAQRLPEAEALLRLLGALSLTLVAGVGGEEILEPAPGRTPLWGHTRVRALFPADLDLQRAARMLTERFGADIAVAVTALSDAEWTAALAREPHRLAIGARLMIASAQDDTPERDRVVVRLNRGLGFGTGDHPTTRLCLEWLDTELVPGASVVDYGAGSGILAIAALRLGAARAWAVDIEPQAVQATLANGALNGVEERLWAGRPEALPTASADVVLANILAAPLIELARPLAALTEPAGTLVLAGLLPEQYGGVAEAYGAHFASLARCERDGWLCVIATR